VAKNQGKVGSDKSDTIAALPKACSDEDAAVAFMEQQRWGDKPVCPRDGCGSAEVYRMEGESARKRYLWRCRSCGKQYTVKVNSIMEDSPIPVRHWCYAFWAACASKKGVSALQIKRQTGLSYKSALYMMHRIRWAMADDSNPAPLSGDVEVDETYVGGKPRKGSRRPRANRLPGQSPYKPGPAEDFKDRKTPVVGMVERGGTVRGRVFPSVTAANLKGAIRECVDPSARILTDERRQYIGIGQHFAGGHETVNHSAGEYARGDVHINSAESMFALLKRSIIGTYHNVSRKHLHRYVGEVCYRINTRYMEDGERTVLAIQQGIGRRLRYADQING
jgi:transposase-like protein